MTNGDTSSEFINKLTSYPVVNDTLEAVKSNPYGKKSLDLSQAGYDKFVSPFVPYAERPYGYVKPYVGKVDDLASVGLSKVDQTFPIIKETPENIKSTILDYAYFPFRVVGDGKDYIIQTYSSEYKKCGGDGLVSGGKAMITTSLVVTSDTLAWLSSFLSEKKEEGTDYASKKYGQASNYAHEKSAAAQNYAQEQSAAAQKYANDKSEQVKNLAYQKKEEAEKSAGQAKETAEKKGTEAKQTAKEKSGK